MDARTRIWFLVYPQRSGSTFLAAQLNRFASRVLVVPETRMVEYLFARGASHRFSHRELRRMIELDHQVANLGLSQSHIASLIDRSAHHTAIEVLRNLIGMLEEQAGIDAVAVIVKLGTQIFNLNRLHEHFGGVHLLALYRDPRGVVNSLLRNERPNFPGEKMGRGDLWFATQRWKRFMAALARAMRQPWTTTLVVGYEELIGDTQACLHTLAGGLGVPADGRPEAGMPLDVREQERAIHRLVNLPSQRGRIDGWRRELRRYQGMAIEGLAREEMAGYGYEVYFARRSGAVERSASLLRCYIEHVLITAAHFLRRALYYSRRPALALLRVRVWRARD